MWASKTLDLVVMEIKVEGFFLTHHSLLFNNNQFRRSNGPIISQSKEGGNELCVNGMKDNYKEIRDSCIFEKLWLKAAKSIRSKRNLLKFVSKTGSTPSPYLPSEVTLRQLLISLHLVLNNFSAKQETDVLDIRAFCLHPIRCSLQDFYLNKVILPWSDYIFVFNEMGTGKPRIRKPRNTLCKQLMIKRRRCIVIQYCFYVND